MTATVFVTLEVKKMFIIPDVRSTEEAETMALDQMAEDFEDDQVEIVGIDSFEGGESVN